MKGDVRFRATKCLEHPSRKGHKGDKIVENNNCEQAAGDGLHTPRFGNESVFSKMIFFVLAWKKKKERKKRKEKQKEIPGFYIHYDKKKLKNYNIKDIFRKAILFP